MPTSAMVPFDTAETRLRYPDLERFLGGLDRYFNQGIRPGHFLTAVLENDLQQAYGRADADSLSDLPRLMMLLYNDAPSNAFGSPEKVKAWIADRKERRAAASA